MSLLSYATLDKGKLPLKTTIYEYKLMTEATVMIIDLLLAATAIFEGRRCEKL